VDEICPAIMLLADVGVLKNAYGCASIPQDNADLASYLELPAKTLLRLLTSDLRGSQAAQVDIGGCQDVLRVEAKPTCKP
jgi:hypothetical protein